MTLFLSKLLPLLVYPLGAVILLGLAALVLTFTRFRKSTSIFITISLVILWVGSMPISAKWVVARLQSEYPPILIKDAPQVDAIILLGGVVGQPVGPAAEPNLGDAVDRVVEALRLYRAEKAPRILVTAGNLPWLTAAASEAQLIANLLVEFGVPRSALVLETQSRNTRENAVNTAALFRARGWHDGILVTSGTHMPRAIAVFRRVGLAVTPVATDMHTTDPLYESVLDIMPNADALAQATAGLKEYIGFAVYKYRGWI